MTDNQIIQMHDYAGKNQYPVTLASLVYDEDGETVGKKLALLLDWFEGGIGTITGIFVNGVTYNEPDELGVLTIPDYPTSLEWADISGRPTHLSQFTDDVVAGHYLPLTGGTMSGAIQWASATLTESDSVSGAGLRMYAFTELEAAPANSIYHSVLSAVSSYCGLQLAVYGGENESHPFFRRITTTGTTAWEKLAFLSDVGDFVKKSGDAMTGNLVMRNNAIVFDLYQSDTWANPQNSGLRILNTVGASATEAISSYAVGLSVSGYYGFQLASDGGNYALYYRGTSTGANTGDWKTVAFTDSTVAGARTLKDGAGNSIIYLGNNGQFYIGDVIYANTSTKILGKNIYLASGESATTGIVLNSYGNVTIGSSDLAGTNAKLYVDGSVYVGNVKVLDRVSNNLHIGEGIRDAFDTSIFGTNILFNTTSGERAMMIAIGGYVGIGTNNPTAKLQVAGDVNIVGYRLYWGESDYYSIGSESDNSSIPPHLAYRGYNGHRFYNSYGESMRIDEYGRVGIGTESPSELLHVAGNIRLKNDSNYGCSLKFGDKDYCYLHEDYDDHLNIYADNGIALLTNGKGVTIDKSLTIGSAVLSWDSVNNALKIEGNVYTTGQLSAGGVGTEVQKVFNIAAANDTTTANTPYTTTLTHNLNTYDLAVVVYEVTLQSDGITETLTQVLADVTLTDENKVTVSFASRKTGKKYRIVIVG